MYQSLIEVKYQSVWLVENILGRQERRMNFRQLRQEVVDMLITAVAFVTFPICLRDCGVGP